MEPNRKILSVIVPSYNVEKYLDETLNSLTNINNINDIDVIVVNDGSQDNTNDIASKYVTLFPDSVKLINKINGGHGSAVNSGLENSEGRYVCVVDGDDWVQSKALDDILSYLKEIDVDLVLTNYKTVNQENGNEKVYSFHGIDYKKIYTMEELEKFQFYFTMTTICYKKELLDNTNLLLQEKTFYVDEEYCLIPFSKVEKIIFLDTVFYNYRIGNVNQSISIVNQIKKIDDKMRVIKRMIEFYNVTQFEDANNKYVFKRICGMVNSVYLVMLIYNADKYKGRKFVNSFRKYLKDNNKRLLHRTRKYYLIFLSLSYFGFGSKQWELYKDLKYKLRNK